MIYFPRDLKKKLKNLPSIVFIELALVIHPAGPFLGDRVLVFAVAVIAAAGTCVCTSRLTHGRKTLKNKILIIE